MGAVYVEADEVAEDGVAEAVGGDEHTVLQVAGDQVAGSGSGSSDGIAGGVHKGDSGVGIAQGIFAGGIGADEVALDSVDGGVLLQGNPGLEVAGDLVAFAGVEAADGVVPGAVNGDAIAGVAEGGGAVRAGADTVPCTRLKDNPGLRR